MGALPHQRGNLNNNVALCIDRAGTAMLRAPVSRLALGPIASTVGCLEHLVQRSGSAVWKRRRHWGVNGLERSRGLSVREGRRAALAEICRGMRECEYKRSTESSVFSHKE